MENHVVIGLPYSISPQLQDFREQAARSIKSNDFFAYLDVVTKVIDFCMSQPNSSVARINPFYIPLRIAQVREISRIAFDRERGHSWTGGNILYLDRRGCGKSSLMRTMTVVLGLLSFRLVPCYVDMEKMPLLPSQLIRSALLAVKVPESQVSTTDRVEFLISTARDNDKSLLLFIDEVQYLYPNHPEAWFEVAALGGMSTVSVVAGGSGAELGIKAFGRNSELKALGLPERGDKLLDLNCNKIYARRLPGISTRSQLQLYVRWWEQQQQQGQSTTSYSIDSLYAKTGGNLGDLDSLLQDRDPPHRDLDQDHSDFAAHQLVIRELRAAQVPGNAFNVWEMKSVSKGTLLQQLHHLQSPSDLQV